MLREAIPMFEYRLEPIQLDTERSAAYELSDNPHGDYCYSVHFVGKEDMIAQLAQAYPKNVRTPSENRQESSPLPEGFTEVIGDMLEEAVLARILRDFPYLKCTGFHESWSKLAYYVFFSASGYPFITAYTMADYFDKHSDGGAGRFGAEIDVLTRNYYASYLHCQTGTYCGVSYRYPFRTAWDSCDFVLPDENGQPCRMVALNPFVTNGKTLVLCLCAAGDIVLPKGIQKIAPEAFMQGEDITSIVVPDSVSHKEGNPFYYCHKLTAPVYNESRTILFHYPESLTDIHFDVPDTVKYIAEKAFFANRHLCSITFPDGLEWVGEDAFEIPWNASSRLSERSLVFPASLRHLGSQSNQNSITVTGTLDTCGSISCRNDFTVKGDLSECDSIFCKRLTVNGSIQKVKDARIRAEFLQVDGTFPADTLTQVGNPPDIIRTPSMPFTAYDAKCRKAALIGFARLCAENADIAPDIRATYITYLKRQKKRLYELCGEHPEIALLMMQEKIIPADDIALVRTILEKENRVTEVAALLTYGQSVKPTSTADDDLSLDDAPKKKGKKVKEVDPFSPAEIKKEWTFEKLADDSVRLTGYKGIEPNVYIPPRVGNDPVTELGELIFSPDKPRLTASQKDARRAMILADIPEGVKVLGKGAFSGCESLSTLILPTSLTDIGEESFVGCHKLNSIELAEGSPLFTERGVLYAPAEGGTKALFAQSAASCTLRPDTVSLSASLFKGMTALTEITLPDSLKTISDSAFALCTSLNRVILPAELNAVGASAFFGCKALTAVTLPDTLTELGTSAFEGTGLTEITIPAAMKEIGESAFQNCAVLETLTLQEGTVSIGKRAFRYCEKLTAPTFPSTLTTVGQEAFRQCLAFTRLEIPATVTNIQYWGFARCDNAVYHVRANSAAYRYAVENMYRFVII